MHRSLLLLAVLALTFLVGAASAAADTVERPDLEHHFSDIGTTGHDGRRALRRRRPRTWVIGARPQRPALYPVVDLQDPERAARDRPRRGLGRRPALPGTEPERPRRRRAVPAGDLRGRPDARDRAGELLHPRLPADRPRDRRRRPTPASSSGSDYGNRDPRRSDRSTASGSTARWPSRRASRSTSSAASSGARCPSRGGRCARSRDMLVLERDRCTVLRGKTGYVFTTAPRVGWWVGWVAARRARRGRSRSTSTSRAPSTRRPARRSAGRS